MIFLLLMHLFILTFLLPNLSHVLASIWMNNIAKAYLFDRLTKRKAENSKTELEEKSSVLA